MITIKKTGPLQTFLSLLFKKIKFNLRMVAIDMSTLTKFLALKCAYIFSDLCNAF